MSLQMTEIGGKRLELFREIVPRLRRLAIIYDGGYVGSVRESGDVQAIARKLGLEVAPHDIRQAEDFASVFDALKGQTDALYVVENALMVSNRALIVALALKTQLPSTFATAIPREPGPSWLTDRTSRLYFEAPPSMSTRYCAAPMQATCRLSSRPNSISSSMSVPLRRSASPFQTKFSRSPIR